MEVNHGSVIHLPCCTVTLRYSNFPLYRYLLSQIQLTAAQPVLDSSAATIPFAGLPPPHHCDAKDSYYYRYYSFRSRFRLEIGGRKIAAYSFRNVLLGIAVLFICAELVEIAAGYWHFKKSQIKIQLEFMTYKMFQISEQNCDHRLAIFCENRWYNFRKIVIRK